MRLNNIATPTKIKLLPLIVFILAITIGAPAHAAFVVKKQTKSEVSGAMYNDIPLNTNLSPKEKRAAKYELVNKLLSDENWHPKKHPASKSGWEGIASLVLAIRGILYFPPASIVAIVFGAMGMGKGQKHRGMAIAGLVIGLLTTFAYGFLIVMALA